MKIPFSAVSSSSWRSALLSLKFAFLASAILAPSSSAGVTTPSMVFADLYKVCTEGETVDLFLKLYRDAASLPENNPFRERVFSVVCSGLVSSGNFSQYSKIPKEAKSESLIAQIEGPCETCNGKGWMPWKKCESCHGSGNCPTCKPNGQLLERYRLTCETCHGTRKCPRCNGSLEYRSSDLCNTCRGKRVGPQPSRARVFYCRERKALLLDLLPLTYHKTDLSLRRKINALPDAPPAPKKVAAVVQPAPPPNNQGINPNPQPMFDEFEDQRRKAEAKAARREWRRARDEARQADWQRRQAEQEAEEAAERARQARETAEAASRFRHDAEWNELTGGAYFPSTDDSIRRLKNETMGDNSPGVQESVSSIDFGRWSGFDSDGDTSRRARSFEYDTQRNSWEAEERQREAERLQREAEERSREAQQRADDAWNSYQSF